MSCVCKSIGVSVDNLSLDLVGPASVVSQAASNHADVNFCHADGLTIVEGLDSGQEVCVLLDQVGKVDQQLAPVLWCLLSP